MWTKFRIRKGFSKLKFSAIEIITWEIVDLEILM
jgi:hypothetical protein